MTLAAIIVRRWIGVNGVDGLHAGHPPWRAT
jgi:hypothetical protein